MSVEIRTTRLAYEAYIDGTRVGELAYSRSGATVTALHTEVEPAAEGKGVGSALARALIDDVRARGDKLVPLCPFVKSYLDRHPEFDDLRVATR